MEKVTEATLHLEKVTEAMAKCNLSLEYLKVTEAMAKCNLSLNYSQKIFWSDWTIDWMNAFFFYHITLSKWVRETKITKYVQGLFTLRVHVMMHYCALDSIDWLFIYHVLWSNQNKKKVRTSYNWTLCSFPHRYTSC